jgi:cytochrome c oxidase cbb3-type subunit III
MKRLKISFAFVFITLTSWAQDGQNVTTSFKDDPFNHPLMPMYLVIALMAMTIILVGIVMLYMVRILNMLTLESEKAKAAKEGVAYVPKPDWWSKFSQTVNASVPVEQEKSIELDHNYDGIKELDNHLPPWWKWLFIGTIGWGAVYLVVFHIADSLPLSIGEYQNEIAYAEEQANRLKASQPQAAVDENTLVFALDSVGLISNGKTVFTDNNCGSCHRVDGGGNSIGPNLTDEYWLHGGHIRNVFATIKNGVVEKGMPAWGKSLSPQQVRDVTFFVLSLQGTKPANAKAPQGVLYKEEIVKSDSTAAQASL